MSTPTPNTLYYGDNLHVLRTHIADESVDLVYLDPPFNSGRDYNAVFEDGDKDGKKVSAQVKAFTDTWRWDDVANAAYEEIVRDTSGTALSLKLSETMKAFRVVLGTGSTLAYLSMMAPRLVELRRCLKPTGSLYLHCDPSASHYLKMLLDGIMGRDNFRNEIVWSYRRWPAKSDNFQTMHDIILRYSRGGKVAWNQLYEPLAPSTLKTFGDKKQVAVFDAKGHCTPGIEARLSLGAPMRDVWEIGILAPISKERRGYPTQKPRALLERIIRASSNEGDVVLDPFCGCGTALDAAVVLKRKWIGIDITHVATNVIKKRLEDVHNLLPGKNKDYLVVGEPADLAGAEQLAEDDKHQFQTWALGLVGARTEAGPAKKGGDKGIDGVKVFATSGGKTERCLISVKGGGVNPGAVRDLRGTMEREKAALGLLITIKPPSTGMKQEAREAGMWEPDDGMDELFVKGQPIPRIQIATIEDLLEGRLPVFPPEVGTRDKTFKRGKRAP